MHDISLDKMVVLVISFFFFYVNCNVKWQYLLEHTVFGINGY